MTITISDSRFQVDADAELPIFTASPDGSGRLCSLRVDSGLHSAGKAMISGQMSLMEGRKEGGNTQHFVQIPHNE